MRAGLRSAVLLLAAILPLEAAGQAQPAPSTGLVIRDAWVRASTTTRTTSSAYFTIENATARSVALVKISVTGVGDAEVHTIVEQQGQASMRPLASVAIPPRGAVEFAPGGTHVMLMDITRPLQVGATVEMTLTFDNGWTRQVHAVVRPLSAVSAR